MPDVTNWGKFSAAVERWAEIIGRPAPAPTDDEGRLSSDFVEWMQGYTEGWVTDCGLSRTAELRLLGNSIVPAQAATAWAHLLGLDVTVAKRERERDSFRLPRYGTAGGTLPTARDRVLG